MSLMNILFKLRDSVDVMSQCACFRKYCNIAFMEFCFVLMSRFILTYLYIILISMYNSVTSVKRHTFKELLEKMGTSTDNFEGANDHSARLFSSGGPEKLISQNSFLIWQYPKQKILKVQMKSSRLSQIYMREKIFTIV